MLHPLSDHADRVLEHPLRHKLCLSITFVFQQFCTLEKQHSLAMCKDLWRDALPSAGKSTQPRLLLRGQPEAVKAQQCDRHGNTRDAIVPTFGQLSRASQTLRLLMPPQRLL